MNDSITRISLDIHSTSSRETVNAKKGDTARRIVISLVDGGIPYIISKDCYAVFTAKKPDGKVVYNDCTIENNTIIYKLTEQTVAVEGRVNSEIKLYGADDKLITSPKFTIAVFSPVYNEGDEIESSDEFNALTRLVSDAMEATENANKAAEKAAHTAKSLMVIGKAEGTGIYLNDAVDQFLVGMRIFGKTTQDGIPTPSAPVDLVSAGDGSVQVAVAAKNLLQCSAVSATSRGITFSVAPDGTVVVNGTATENAYLTVGQVKLHPGKYLLSGDLTGSATTHRIFITNGTREYNNYTADREFTVTESGNWSVRILINAGTAVSDLKLYPMVRFAAISDSSYDRYKLATEVIVSTPNGLNGIKVSTGGTHIDVTGQSWVCDEIDFNRRVHIQRINNVGFENAVGVREFRSASNNTYRFAFPIGTNPTFLPSTQGIGMCNAFTYSFAPVGSNDIDNSIHAYMSGGIYVRCDAYETIGDFLAWAKSINLRVQYILATPIERPLTEEELEAYAAMQTYRGHTTVTNNGAAHMELEYVMDAKKYIDSLIGSAGGGASAGIINATVE